MSQIWRVWDVVEAEARLFLRRVADAVESGPARVPHRGARAQPGGSQPKALRRKSMLRVEKWGVVILFSRLGQKFLWRVRGTKRQKARPVELVPDADRLRKAIEVDALRHFEARDRREARGRR